MRQCTKCKEFKALENFSFRKSRNQYETICKQCMNKWRVEHNKNTNRRETYNIPKVNETRQKFLNYLGGKCIICGYNKCGAALDFHHKNPEEKEFEPTKLAYKKWEVAETELNKCVLLCANCHKIETALQKYTPSKGKTGDKTVQRLCKKHGLTIFDPHYTAGRKYSSFSCRECKKERNYRRVNIHKQKAFDHFGGVCSCCGNTDIRVMEYHHLNPEKKSINISSMWHMAYEKISFELRKCIMVCGNCHREIENDFKCVVLF